MDFFDKFKQGIEKGVTTVSVKSKEAIETTRLKSHIAELQRQKREALEELGSIAYTMYAKDSFDLDRIKARCSNVASLDEQIKKKEAELRESHIRAEEALGKPKPIVVCQCGGDIYEGTKFCGKCGMKVQQAPKTPASNPGPVA